MNANFTIAGTFQELIDLLMLRVEVFVVEQNGPPDEEPDVYDKESTFVVAKVDGKIQGTARFRWIGDQVKIERIAVKKEYRGQCIGTGLVQYALQLIREKHPKGVYLHAQTVTEDFYRRLGFKPVGEKFMEAGIEQGRRPELVGGGLIRSLGGWQAVKDARFSGQDRIKGDHRILGDSAFVIEVLAEGEEKFERFYELKSKGYNLDTIAQKVCDIFGIEPEQIYSKSRQKIRAEARGLYCYWAVVELGYSLADLARLLGMTGQGVGYAVRRGERIAKVNYYRLID